MAAPAVILRDAVVAAIEAAGIDGLTAGAVFPRKRPERLRSDPDKACTVCVQAENEANEYRDNMFVRFDWPILVVLHRKQIASITRSDGWEEEARHLLRRLLYRQLFAEGVEACRYESDPTFPTEGFDKNIDVSGQRFTYRYVEPAAD